MIVVVSFGGVICQLFLVVVMLFGGVVCWWCGDVCSGDQHVCICRYIYIYMCVDIYECVYVCMCIHKDKPTM